MSWTDASAYCAWRGGRLPTELEWERAAAGLLPEHRRYVWGDSPPDGQAPSDVTPEGVQGLGGGLSEWVTDGGDFYPALPRIRDAGADAMDAMDASDVVDAESPDVYERTDEGLYVWHDWQPSQRAPWRVVRGGHDGDAMERRTTTLRRFRMPDDQLEWVGFRCVYDQPPRE